MSDEYDKIGKKIISYEKSKEGHIVTYLVKFNDGEIIKWVENAALLGASRAPRWVIYLKSNKINETITDEEKDTKDS